MVNGVGLLTQRPTPNLEEQGFPTPSHRIKFFRGARYSPLIGVTRLPKHSQGLWCDICFQMTLYRSHCCKGERRSRSLLSGKLSGLEWAKYVWLCNFLFNFCILAMCSSTPKQYLCWVIKLGSPWTVFGYYAGFLITWHLTLENLPLHFFIEDYLWNRLLLHKSSISVLSTTTSTSAALLK